MKQNRLFKTLFVLVMIILGSTRMLAADGDLFTAQTIEGVELVFKIISETDKTCQVGTDEWNDGNPNAVDATISGTITIPTSVNGYSVVAIGNYAFHRSYNIEVVNIPESVTSIGEQGLNDCTSLISIDIPASVTNIGYVAFAGCSNVQSIRVAEGNPVYDSRNDCNAIISTSNNQIVRGCQNTIIPEGITSLGVCSFNSCSNLSSIVLPSSLKSIGGWAFDSTDLTTIEIPQNVYSIGTKAFMYCHSLTSVIIPSNVSSIGDYAFTNCTSLERVYCYINEPFPVDEETFQIYNQDIKEYEASNATLYVPYGTKQLYESSAGWNQFQNIVEMVPYAALSSNNTVLTFYYDEKKEERNGMDVGPFDIDSDKAWYSQRESITSVVIDDSFANCTTLTSIAEWFSGLTNLTTITGLSNLKTENVTDMHSMFSSCSSLKALDLSGLNTAKVTNMGAMFYMCSSLESLNVSSFNTQNVVNMQNMFQSCSSLTSLDVTSFDTHKVENMANLFDTCSGLTNIDLSHFNTENVKNMDYMFVSCENLQELNLTNFDTHNVERMNGTFSVCMGLKSLDLSSFVTSKVTNTNEMFYYCMNLATIYVGNGWTTANVTDSGIMFTNCFSLVGGQGTVFDADHTDATYARIDGGPNSPGYFTDKNAPVVSGDFGNRMLLLWRQVGGKEYRLYKALDKNQYKTNDDGWKMYLTQLTLDIVDGNDVTTVVVDEGTIYTDDNRYNDMMIPSMMIDKERNMMYVFSNSKPDNGNYTMNGYAYLSPLDQPAFNKEMVFDNSNWGWFSIFTGTTSDGQPVLSHFSYAGYYDMVSTRTQEGYWTSESLDNIMPDDTNARWAKTNKVTVIGDTSDDEVTIDGLVYTLRSNNQAAISWVNERNQLEQLELPSQINHGGTVRTVTAIAPFAFYWCNNLHELNIPSSVSQIEELALRKCSALEKLRVDNATPPYLKNDEEVTPFDEATCESAILYVPNGAKAAYQEANGWKDFKNIEEFGEPVVTNPEPYAVLSENNTVLTFYYDEHKEERNGMSVGPFEGMSGWYNQRENITNVVFDASFANCTTLTSTAEWLYGFKNLTSITGISNLKTDNVTDMTFMFCSCSSLTDLDVSGFKTNKVTTMEGMFYGCSSLTSLDLSSFNTENVTNMEMMFQHCYKLKELNISSFNTSKVTSFFQMFIDCYSLESLDVSSFNTESATGMRWMFGNCSGLTSLDVSNFNTSNVQHFGEMFNGCSNLESLDVSNFNTQSAQNMWSMFVGCQKLTSLDLSNFNTENVTAMQGMFENSSNIRTIYVGDGWSTANVSEGHDMFIGCTSLVGGKGTHYDADHIDYTYARIDGGPNSQMPGYFTRKGDAPWVDPNALVLTGKIDNYWYDETGGSDGFDAIIISVALPPGEVSVWESNVLNSFIANKLAFTTQDGEPVDNVEGRILFTEKDHWKTFDGGRILVYEDADMQGEVAEIDPESGMLRILNTDVTRSLLSATDRYVSLPLCVKAYIADEEVSVTNGSFTVMATKPLSFESISQAEVSFGMNQDVSVSLDELIRLKDWRNQQLIRNDSPDLYEHYRVDNPIITGTENGEEPNTVIMTNLNSPDGSLRPLSEVAPYLAVSYNPDLNHGTLTFVNYGNIPGSFTMYVPVTINHEWGSLSDQVVIKNGGDMPHDSEPYAVLSENNTVLTFYYDEHKEQRNGMSVGPFYWDTQSWLNQRDQITTVVFDSSFADCNTITSTSLWFTRFSQLTNIIGISNLNTNNVTDMSWMFCDCPKLESIDLSHFNTANVTSMREMFGRTTLKQIDLSSFNTENVTDVEYMFDNSPNLTNINMSNFSTRSVTNFTNMFSGCSGLASIQAGSAAIPDSIYALVENPNLLVYVNEARLAPEGVQNVVVNGVAKEIVLKDAEGNNNWYCPEPFRAEKISYTREFRQQTQIGISRGWESLALPFAVQTITHQDKGVIAPFGSDASNLHFWLRRLGHEGLISVQMIEPNTPYVISMPNSEDYPERFNLNGRVTFAAEDAYVERTEQMADESADYMMVPAFQRMAVSEDIYALNVGEERNGRPEGSIFERNYREVRPFEAYTLHRGDQPAPLFFDLSDLEGSTTDMPDVRWKTEEGSDEWVTLDGRKLQKAPTAKGVYIYNGRKTVVK